MRAETTSPETSVRVLGPTSRDARPFPRYAPLLLLPLVIVSIVDHFGEGSVSLLPEALAASLGAVGAIASAAWLEDEIYRRTQQLRVAWRLIVAILLPLAILIAMALAINILGRLLGLLGLGFALAVFVGIGGLWATSASVGSLLVSLIDGAVSAVIPDFRSRILAAVMGLLSIAILFVWVLMKVVVDLVTRLERGEVSGEMSFSTTGEEARAVPTAEFFAGDPEGLAGLAFFAGLVMIAPAALSVAGKLADAVMARIGPLGTAFEAVGTGDRAIRIEEGGSVELSRMAERFNRMVEDLELAEKLERAFGIYVSPQIMARIKERHGEASIPAELREATVLFLDIRAFTSMSERLAPETVAAVLNRFFERVVEVVDEHEGYLDKFIGDAVIAVWNGPVDQPEHARLAVDCATALQRATEEMNEAGAFPESGPLGIGIGVATGQVFCGNVGGAGQMEYTVIGDTVNLAARLTSKAPAKEVWISPKTAETLGDEIEGEPLEPLHLKGKKEPVRPLRVWPRAKVEAEEAE